ncbi:hypothetical protein [Altererythrobacter sp. BO-6]|uniref:hypothetical protein n=1 Tax=Altererythrobacter sp. BO-6 TaxID=2604537 RepID=UPI0019D2CC8F|nr:hypothetical protein [Altererythrobacter sp. BO-6]
MSGKSMLHLFLLAVSAGSSGSALAVNPALEAKARAADPAYQQAEADDPKPVHPGAGWLRQVDTFLSNFNCASSDFGDDLVALDNLNGLEDVLRKHVAEIPDLRAEAKYHELLKAWLLKRLRNEGGLTKEQLGNLLTADPGISTAEQLENFKRQAEIGNRLGEAEDTHDGMALCEAVRDSFLYDWQTSTDRADRLAVLNAALEAEANRLGITLK